MGERTSLGVLVDTQAERLKFAQWVLERNLSWIAASDVKTGVVVAVDTAMLAGLVTAFAGHAARNRGVSSDRTEGSNSQNRRARS